MSVATTTPITEDTSVQKEKILPPSPKGSKNVFADTLFANTARFFAFFVFILLAAIMVSLVYGSRETIAEFGLGFLTTNDWDPGNDIYGAVVPIIGTVITAGLALFRPLRHTC